MTKNKPAIVRAVQPSAKLEIDGEKYELVYDFNAIAEAEAETGGAVNLLHGIAAMVSNSLTALQLRGILYASIKPLRPAFTIRQAGPLIRLDTMPLVIAAISEAWNLSMPEKKKDPSGAAEPRDGE